MELKAKFVFVGDSQVGKTSILTRFKDKEFNPYVNTTIGNVNTEKIMVINNKRINLQIWDTAGQERFRNIAQIHYRDAQIIALVYDVTEESSKQNLDNWMNTIQQQTNSEYVVILVGNKVDKLDQMDQEIDETVQEIMDEYNLKHIFTSAKDNIGVKEMFEMSVQEADNKGIIERNNEKVQ